MTNLTLTASTEFLEQILKFAKNLAKTQNEKLEISTNFTAKNNTLNIIKEARNNINLSKSYTDINELRKDLLND